MLTHKTNISQALIRQEWYLLPVLSALLVIGTLPPLKLWWLCFVSIAPLHYFARISRTYTWKQTSTGGFLFGVIFTAYIVSLTLLQFHWVKEVYLFTYIIRASSLAVLVFFGIFSSIQILVLRFIKSEQALVYIFFASSFWTLSEWIIHKVMLGIEYSIIGYPAHNSIFVSLARYGGVYASIFAVALINISICTLVYYTIHKNSQHRNKNIIYSILVLLIVTSVGYAAHIIQTQEMNAQKQSHIHIATIQYQDKYNQPFGSEKEDTKTKERYFSFPPLEDTVLRIQKEHSSSSLLIVYPFAPWNGAIGTRADKSRFDKKVVATDFETFGAWTSTYIKKENTFITWNTTLRDSDFFNEIHAWKDGTLIEHAQKYFLFPFLDYTPSFSQKLGLFTTPIDSSAGTSTFQNTIYDRKVGALVCSEVTHHIHKTPARGSDIVLAIGSEALFSSGIAGEFNLANSVYRAVESNTVIVRANRFGPSGVIKNNGDIISELGYQADGVLYTEVGVPKKTLPTPFEQHGGTYTLALIFITFLSIGYSQYRQYKQNQD